MTDPRRPGVSPADATFLERCRVDLTPFLGSRDVVLEIVQRAAEDGLVELEAHVVVSGQPATFTARGETVVEAHGRLRAMAPEQRLGIAYRALVDARDPS